MNNKKKYNGVLSPEYKSIGGIIGGIFDKLLGNVTVSVPQEDNFTDEQDPEKLYQHEKDRAWTKEEDPQGIYKGTLRPGSYTREEKVNLRSLGGK